MNDSSETYRAPKTVAIHVARPSRGSILVNEATATSDDPDGDEQQAAALEDLGKRRVEHDDEGERGPERRERRVPGGPQETEDLDGGERRDERDRGRQDRRRRRRGRRAGPGRARRH